MITPVVVPVWCLFEDCSHMVSLRVAVCVGPMWHSLSGPNIRSSFFLPIFVHGGAHRGHGWHVGDPSRCHSLLDLRWLLAIYMLLCWVVDQQIVSLAIGLCLSLVMPMVFLANPTQHVLSMICLRSSEVMMSMMYHCDPVRTIVPNGFLSE